MKECKVNICGCKGVEALVYDFWNGHAMPYIKFKDIQLFADEYTNEFVDITFNDGVLRLYDMQESHTELIYPTTIEGEVVYDLGGLGYCFEVIEDAITESISYIEDGYVVVAVRSNLPFEGAEFDGEMFVLYNQFKLS